jgi:hypothetical protein
MQLALNFMLPTVMVLILVMQASACNPVETTICQAYSRSDAVFVGRLLKMDEVPGSSIPRIEAQFSVKRIFKGTPKPVETVRFIAGDCGTRLPAIGAEYFVYEDPKDRDWFIANRTTSLRTATEDVRYAEGLSEKKPVFTVGGWIAGLSESELKKVILSVQEGNKTRRVSIDKVGFFEFVSHKNIAYKVNVLVPYSATFTTTNLGAVFQSYGNLLTYTIQFRPNECDWREIEVYKDK